MNKKISQLLSDTSFKYRDGSFKGAQHKANAVQSSQSGRCCCIGEAGGSVLCTQISLQQREAQGVKSDSKLCTTLQILETDLPLFHPDSPIEHQRGALCPGSKPQPVMTGWQCWQESAEPTTPPGLWAQSSSSQHWGSSQCTEQALGCWLILHRLCPPTSAPPLAKLHTQI